MRLNGGLETAALRPRRAAVSEAAVTVRRGFGWSLLGYAVYMACQWSMLVVLTRWGSPDLGDVATFAMALATATPIILCSNLGLRRVYATDVHSVHAFRDYVTLRMLTNGAALAAISAAVWILGYRSELVWATLAMAAAKVIESTSDILHGFFQKRRRIDLAARSAILRGVLSLAGFAGAFAATGNVAVAVLGMGAGWAAVLLFYEWPRAIRFLRESGPATPSRPGALRHLARAAWPLGVVALVVSIKASIPTFVVESRLGVTAVGLFAAVLYFHHGINRVVSALGEAASERLASLHAGGDVAGLTRLLRRMLGVTLGVSAATVAVAWIAGGPLLHALYGPRYAGMGGLLAAILAAACVANLQTVFDYAMTALRNLRVQPYLYGGGAVLLGLLCAAFVPAMGLSGAALALGIVSGIELLAAAAIVGWALRGSSRAGER